MVRLWHRLVRLWYRLPLATKIAVLVVGLMVTVAVTTSQVVLWRFAQDQKSNLELLTGAYLDGLSAAVLPALVRRDVRGRFGALDRAQGDRYAGFEEAVRSAGGFTAEENALGMILMPCIRQDIDCTFTWTRRRFLSTASLSLIDNSCNTSRADEYAFTDSFRLARSFFASPKR
jgi:hypothetical protein